MALIVRKFMKIFESGLQRLCIILVLFMVLLPVFSFSQQPTKCDYVRPHEADQWIFGEGSHLDFKNGNPISSSTTGILKMYNGMSSISDKDGNLLLFTDGKNIWKGNYGFLDTINTEKRMEGGILKIYTSPKTSIIVPAPGRNDTYYIFVANMFVQGFYTAGANYSIVEKINGSWKVTERNHFLFKPNSQKVTAVKHNNGKDYWVLLHGYGNSIGGSFYVYLVEENGVSENVISIGSVHEGNTGTSPNNNGGYIKASADGKKIAIVIPDEGIIEVFNFNTENGSLIKDPLQGSGTFIYPTGVEFSPDNSFLYVSTNPTSASKSFLYQFDLNQANYLSNPYIVFEEDNANFLQSGLQMGVDGKIYQGNTGIASSPHEFLSVINNPNRKGSACNFNEINGVMNNGLILVNSMTLDGLPNFVSSYLDIPQINYVNHCATEITYFNLRNSENIDNISWDFGDGNTSTVENGTENTYQSAGNYTVNVTEKYGSGTYIYDRDVTIYPLPSVDLGDSIIYILQNTSITLDAGEYDEYLWQPGGSTDRYLDVSNEGIYTVTVTDTNCCVNTDEVEIRYANIYVPNAFKPTSSVTENRTFKVFGPTSALLNFDLKIFNRWGQLVFASNDPEKGWDGTFEGGDAATGVYVWVLNYSSTASRYQESQSYTLHGTLTLLR
jgi:gliding motility-associated-like protein